jgi:Na+-driven multidrug efflux pump
MTSTYQEKPIKKTFYKAIRFMLVADIVQSLQEMMLDYFISKHLGSDGLAAFGIAYPLITVIIALIACPVAGVQAICAKDVSKKDYESARVHLCSGLTWGFLIMSVFTLICWFFHNPFITALGAEGEYAYLREASTQALLVSTVCGPFLCVLIILLTNLIFNENRKNSAFLGIFSIALQIIITGVTSSIIPTMAGIWGGYALSLAISDFLILLYLRISHKDPDSMFYHIRPMFKFSGVQESLKTGLPEMLCWAYFIPATALRNSLVIHIGNKDALAAVTLSDGAELCEFVMTALFYAVLVTIGSAYGSQDREKYHAYISTVAKSIVKFAVAGGIVLTLTAWPLLNFFYDKNESQIVFDITLKLMFIYSFYFVFYLINNMFSALYETIGLLKYAHINYLLEAMFYAFLMVVLGYSIGIDGIWIAQPIAEILLLLFNLKLVWNSCGHFPRSFADLGFDKEVFKIEEG